jgi:hypothetical protein
MLHHDAKSHDALSSGGSPLLVPPQEDVLLVKPCK